MQVFRLFTYWQALFVACHFFLILPVMKTYLMARPIIPGLAPLLLLLLLSSCLPVENCEESAANPLRIGFYETVANTGQPRAYAIDSLTVFGVNRPDSLLYDNRKNVRTIEVPLNPSTDSTGFVVVFPANVIDTLWIRYLRQPVLVSADCGFTMYYEINQVTHTSRGIQSSQIFQPFVRNTLEEHLRIIINSGPDD